jgi:hypothetical protein
MQLSFLWLDNCEEYLVSTCSAQTKRSPKNDIWNDNWFKWLSLDRNYHHLLSDSHGISDIHQNDPKYDSALTLSSWKHKGWAVTNQKQLFLFNSHPRDHPHNSRTVLEKWHMNTFLAQVNEKHRYMWKWMLLFPDENDPPPPSPSLSLSHTHAHTHTRSVCRSHWL